MKPFYSIDDLEAMFDFHDPRNVADALRAAGVPMIYDGHEADLSGWRRPKVGSVTNAVIRGGSFHPDPDEVMVAWDTLPDSWRRHIQTSEAGEIARRVPDELGTRERNSMLRIIVALARQAKIDLASPKAPEQLEKLVEMAGFTGPRLQTIKKLWPDIEDLD